MENSLNGYLVLDRKKYKEILASAKGNKIDFKTIGSTMYYKILFPEQPVFKVTLVTPETPVVKKQEFKPAVYEYKQFDNLTGKSNHYQWCENCQENRPHYKRGGYLVCRTCYIGYKM